MNQTYLHELIQRYELKPDQVTMLKYIYKSMTDITLNKPVIINNKLLYFMNYRNMCKYTSVYSELKGEIGSTKEASRHDKVRIYLKKMINQGLLEYEGLTTKGKRGVIPYYSIKDSIFQKLRTKDVVKPVTFTKNLGKTEGHIYNNINSWAKNMKNECATSSQTSNTTTSYTYTSRENIIASNIYIKEQKEIIENLQAVLKYQSARIEELSLQVSNKNILVENEFLLDTKDTCPYPQLTELQWSRLTYLWKVKGVDIFVYEEQIRKYCAEHSNEVDKYLEYLINKNIFITEGTIFIKKGLEYRTSRRLSQKQLKQKKEKILNTAIIQQAPITGFIIPNASQWSSVVKNTSRFQSLEQVAMHCIYRCECNAALYHKQETCPICGKKSLWDKVDYSKLLSNSKIHIDNEQLIAS